MMGDGVNDVLSLKKAHLGVAMQSGSQATRSVADIVLINDSFAALPAAFQEGQRIVNGMQDIVRLFLTRTFYVTMLIIATAIVSVDFPITPMHNSVLAFLTVGLPTLLLAMWARPGPPSRGLLRSTVHFVIPAGFTVTVVGLVVYLFSLLWTKDVATARTALTSLTVFCGLALVPFVEPPTKLFVGGDELSGDWRPTGIALAMLGVYAVLMLVKPLREGFELATLTVSDYLLMGLIVLVWAWVLREMWRRRSMDKFLGFDFKD
jgi:cation-transporting ATPase E